MNLHRPVLAVDEVHEGDTEISETASSSRRKRMVDEQRKELSESGIFQTPGFIEIAE